jgi:hypothetical protein
VVDLAGTSTHHIGKNPEYYYPHDMPILQKVESISEIESTVAEIKGDPSTRLNRLNDKFRRLDAMYEVWSREDVLADPVLITLQFTDVSSALPKAGQLFKGMS